MVFDDLTPLSTASTAASTPKETLDDVSPFTTNTSLSFSPVVSKKHLDITPSTLLADEECTTPRSNNFNTADQYPVLPDCPAAPSRAKHTQQALKSAISTGNSSKVVEVTTLDGGVDPNTSLSPYVADKRVVMPLLLACSTPTIEGQDKVIETLLTAGAAVNTVNDDNQNALHILSGALARLRTASVSVAGLPKSRRKRPNTKRKKSLTRSERKRRQKMRQKCAEILCAAGIDTRLADEFGKKPEDYA
eukprot:Lankesteria_metandrocarpae@DN5138_c0_g1_i1.p1